MGGGGGKRGERELHSSPVAVHFSHLASAPPWCVPAELNDRSASVNAGHDTGDSSSPNEATQATSKKARQLRRHSTAPVSMSNSRNLSHFMQSDSVTDAPSGCRHPRRDDVGGGNFGSSGHRPEQFRLPDTTARHTPGGDRYDPHEHQQHQQKRRMVSPSCGGRKRLGVTASHTSVAGSLGGYKIQRSDEQGEQHSDSGGGFEGMFRGTSIRSTIGYAGGKAGGKGGHIGQQVNDGQSVGSTWVRRKALRSDSQRIFSEVRNQDIHTFHRAQ